MADKKGNKKWYEILAVKSFNNQVIGETPAYEDKNLIGRIIDVNLGNLTRDAKLQNIKLKFKINEAKEDKAYADINCYELMNSYIKRIVKVEKSRIDDSFLCITKDNINIRVKPLILTKFKAQRNVLTKIRDVVKKDFIDYVKKEDYDKLVMDLISKKIQRELRSKLNKIYPISSFEIRIMERI